MKGGSIRLRLLVAAAISVGFALLLGGFGLVYLFERHVERRVAQELSGDLDRLIGGLIVADGSLVVSRPPPDARFDIPLSGFYWQVEDLATGKLIRSRSLWDARLSPPILNGSEAAPRLIEMDGPGNRLLVGVDRTLDGIPGAPDRVVRIVVAQDHREVTSAASAFGFDLIPSLALLGAVLVAAAGLQVAVGLAPLERLRRGLGEVIAGRSRRLTAQVPSEVRPLSDEIDRLLDSQEKALERARSRAADLAHGLKTPLQVLAGDIRRLRERGATDIADEIEEVAAALRLHVDRELARARIAGPGDGRPRTPVAEVAGKVVSVVQRMPQGSSLAFINAVPSDLTAAVEAGDLTEVLGNLVENAVRYARAEVRIGGEASGGGVRLWVVDDGPGIPDATDRATVLARGKRLDQTGSAGLGLAIVGEIAEAHGGALALEDAAPGLRAVLTFPPMPPSVAA